MNEICSNSQLDSTSVYSCRFAHCLSFFGNCGLRVCFGDRSFSTYNGAIGLTTTAAAISIDGLPPTFLSRLA